MSESSFCGGGNCVVVVQDGDEMTVHDSKDPGREPLRFDRDEWQTFLQSVKDGEFD